jgi:hypothetical protein
MMLDPSKDFSERMAEGKRKALEGKGSRARRRPTKHGLRLRAGLRLAMRIRLEHQRVISGWQDSLKHAEVAGALLIQAKDAMAHGTFMTWVVRSCDFSHATANLYMRIARDWSRIAPVANSERVTNLSLRQALRLTGSTAPPLTETTRTLLGLEERVGKEFAALLRKLETVMAWNNQLQGTVAHLTPSEAEHALTTLLTLRRHLDVVIAEVERATTMDKRFVGESDKRFVGEEVSP